MTIFNRTSTSFGVIITNYELRITNYDLLVSLYTTAPKGVNYSFAGSSTGLGNAVINGAPLPGVLAQTNLFAQGFIANNQQADPNALFYDVVANAALAAVGSKSASVPEPSAMLGILALGVGAAGVLKRKQEKLISEKV